MSTPRFWYVVMFCATTLLFSACGGGGGDNTPSGQGNCASNNSCPTANAGPDQTVLVGKQVTLDGSQSSSPTNGLLTYEWILTKKPAGSTIMLAGATTVRPTFTADVEGTYTAKLVVMSAGASSNPDTVNVTAGTGNLPPIANAGPDSLVPVGKPVALDGTRSYDPNDTPLTYAWRLQTQPPKSQAVLLNPNSATPSITPDVAGDYKISLTVNDGTLTSPPNQVTITAIVGNSPPLADAGPDQTVPTGQRVTLIGAGSRDPDGDPLTYLWRFENIPDGSTVSLANAATVSTSFTPDLSGFYVVCLVANDGRVSSACDVVVIKASSLSFSPIDVPGQTQIAALDGINNLGHVIGSFTDASGQHGFLAHDGQFRTIDYPGVTITSANGINDLGQIIGSALAADNTFYGYLEANDQFTTLFQGTYPSNRRVVAGINNNGDIVGDTLCSSCAIFDQGFLRRANGDLITISFPGGLTSTRPSDINDSGQIVGLYFFGTCCNPAHGFLLENGSFTTLDMPGASLTEALGINNSGKIVGDYHDSSGRQHGFLLQNGLFTTVDIPGSTATSLTGINDQDQLVGTFADASGPHGFIGRFGN